MIVIICLVMSGFLLLTIPPVVVYGLMKDNMTVYQMRAEEAERQLWELKMERNNDT